MRAERIDTVEKSLEEVLGTLLSKHMVVSAVYVIITIILMAVLNKASKRYQNKIDPTDLKLRAFVRSMFNGARIVVVIICIFAVLQANEINISSMVTGVGLVSAIAGLAMQDLFKDVIMGVHIVNDNSIVVGEVVEINGIEGIVLSFSLMTTRLKDLATGDIVTMCNRNITQVAKKGGIYSIKLSLSYDEDPERIREVMTRTAAEIAGVKGISRAEYIGIQDYADSAVVYAILYYCSPKIHYRMHRAALAIVQRHVIENHLEIPYPQMEVHEKKARP